MQQAISATMAILSVYEKEGRKKKKVKEEIRKGNEKETFKNVTERTRRSAIGVLLKLKLQCFGYLMQ